MTENMRRLASLCLALLILAGVNPAIAKECLECHGDVVKQMSGNSHHVQGTAVSGRHCYACHWEATAEGQTNAEYHNNATGIVDLVVWEQGVRPGVYLPGSTAVRFLAADMGTAGERAGVANVSRHCLGCHSDAGNDSRPFIDDDSTPSSYSWDRQSVASRYSQKGTTTWGKYSTAATNKKQRITKSLSAHGNATANQGGWNPASGYDGNIVVSRGGTDARNIECFDCHNAHGSAVTGITSSYRTFDGSYNGALLKETIAGKGGYRMTYSPSVNADSAGRNPYNAGAGLCFDCHETASAGVTPWGYNSTFGAEQPIMGYKDTLRFGSGSKGSTARFANRQGRTEIASSHLKAGRFLNNTTHARINGLCTPCHDPHGVSRSLGKMMPYAVPLLKGTWLTSPYQEDGPPSGTPGKSGLINSNIRNNQSAVAGGGGGTSSLRPISMAGMKYNVDRNTFAGEQRITENDETFGGVCLKCHAKEKLLGATVHRAVKGWGNNREHSFPCSKCHQAHNSGLPRLMQTNCFEIGPADLRDNSGVPWLPERAGSGKGANKQEQQTGARTDSNSKNKTAGKVSIMGCHVKQFGKNSSPSVKKGNEQWNQKSAW